MRCGASFLLISLFLSVCCAAPSHAVEVSRHPPPYRIGILGTASAQSPADQLVALKSGLRDLGWNNDRVTFTERWADGHPERLPNLAADLVALNVDVIVAFGAPSVAAAMRATQTIAIVFPLGWDPVGEKVVQSLRHPGGNVTGLSLMAPELHRRSLGRPLVLEGTGMADEDARLTNSSVTRGPSS